MLIDLAYFVGHSSTQMILNSYAKYIESKALEADRDIISMGTKIGYSRNLKAENEFCKSRLKYGEKV